MYSPVVSPKLKEKLRKLREQKLAIAPTREPIPDRWSDFVRLTRIRSADAIANFEAYPYQKEIIDLITRHQFTVIAKGRQLGCTLLASSYLLWRAAQSEAFTGLILSKTQQDTSFVARRLRRMVESIPDFLTPETDSLTDLKLVNGGRILFRNSTPAGTRGLDSVSAIIYDECAFCPEIEEIYKASIPTTSMLGNKARIIILSTPNGQSGWFFDRLSLNNGDRDVLSICEQIRTQQLPPIQTFIDQNGWAKVLLHWRAHPIYSQQDNYLEDVQKTYNLPKEQVVQEYDLSFLDSTELVFNSVLIRERACCKLEDPIPGAIYYGGLDSSLLGSDYTVLTILKLSEDKSKYQLVGIYRKRKQATQLHLYHISEMLQAYNLLEVAVEVTGCGEIYYQSLCSDNQLLNIKISPIKTTQGSKLAMVNKLLLWLEKNWIIFPNKKEIIEEFLSFRRVGDKLGAIPGERYHDDIIMSLCFAVMIAPDIET